MNARTDLIVKSADVRSSVVNRPVLRQKHMSWLRYGNYNHVAVSVGACLTAYLVRASFVPTQAACLSFY